ELGETAEAATCAVEASDSALRLGPSAHAYQASLFEAVAHLENGDLAAADRAIDAVRDHPIPANSRGLLPLRRAMVALARGDSERALSEARAALAETHEHAGAWGTTRAQALLIVLGDAAARGDVTTASQLQEQLQAVLEARDVPLLRAFVGVGEALVLKSREERLRREAEALAAARDAVLATVGEGPPAALRIWRLTRPGR
ncbi:MAG: hypothetical protein AAF602_26175, partial [Myxococcota bacterium]